VDIVCQFRRADVAAGGQGAPLIPLFHQAIVRSFHLDEPVMFLNLGGVANITYVDQETLLAFDTGPASAMIDDFVRDRRGEPFDRDGHLAQTGLIQIRQLEQLLSSDYFHRKPPKSLDRNAFHGWMEVMSLLSDEDGAATLSAFTVESIAMSLQHVPKEPVQWLVGGGGRHNRFLMQELAKRLNVPVNPVEAIGLNGDMLEAECFAWLAVRTLKGLPLSLPTTTGAPYPMTGGELYKAPNPSS
jgi:anhydro-N-acetylmuramic acid kinase